MKVKVISRNPDDYLRETKRDIQKIPRNYDPILHPFEASREYVRALNAVKLERVFAKPFLGSLDGHRDGVHCLCKHSTSLSILLSGSCDGEIRSWNLAQRTCVARLQAHDGFVQGIAVHPEGRYFLSCGNDKTIKHWGMSMDGEVQTEPINTILGRTIYYDIDHHWSENIFATCGEQVDIWDEDRTEPVRTLSWGVDSVHRVKFNPVEKHLLAAAASDRSVMLYDMRGSAPLRKVILKMKSNSIAWNPLEAFVFTVANEDYNHHTVRRPVYACGLSAFWAINARISSHSLYSFDMRKLSIPLNCHMDHVSAVMDVDYSPTGKEFVSGSYDKTIRIFPVDQGRSREVYHTKRMQRVGVVKWSYDSKYLLSGSDEMNIRVWKADASEKLGTLQPRERTAFSYNAKLKEKFAHHPQVKRIARHRHIPKMIYNATRELRTIRESQKRKEANRRFHSKPGAVPFVPERKKHVVSEKK